MFKCMCSVLSWWMVIDVSCWWGVFDVWCYIILYYYTYYIISYTILFSSSLIFYSLPLPLIQSFPLFPPHPLLTIPPLIPINLIHSIRVGTYIRFLYTLPSRNNLTPHVLSDGNVEWCSLYLYPVVFRAGVIYYYIILYSPLPQSIFCSFPIFPSSLLILPSLPSQSYSSSTLLFSSPNPDLIQSIRVGYSLCLFILSTQQFDPAQTNGVDG